MHRHHLSRSSCTIVALALGLLSCSFTLAQQADAGPMRFDDNKVVRVQIRSRQDLTTMHRLSDDCWSESEGLGPVDYRITADKLPALDASGIPYEIYIDDVQALIDRQMNAGAPDDWYAEYHDLAAIRTYVQALADAHPDLAQTFVAGQSLEGRDMMGIAIRGPGDGNKPVYVIEGGIHAREWIAPMSAVYIADTLISSYGSDPELTNLVDHINFYIVPVMNVDGYNYTWTTDRMWRKNRRNNGDGSWGVDLNRNFSVGWGGQGSSGQGWSETYRGTAPFSEPESQVMRDLMLGMPNLGAFLDIHSYGQLILQPYGYTANLPSNHAAYQALGAAMESAMEALYGRNYTHGNTYDTIYPASGITTDWANDDGDCWAFAYEMRDTGQYGFLLPPEQIAPTVRECFAGVLEQARVLMMRLDVGTLRAGQTGNFDVTSAYANTYTFLAYSVHGTGSTYIAPLNVTLDLAQPVQAGQPVRSDANGNASWSLPIPNRTAGRHVWFQALQRENKSNVDDTVIQ